jgi:hypothetical protein
MYEDPHALLGRLRLGREEFCQRLLTMLILGGPYPRWNTRSTPTAAGVDFLRALDRLSFGDPRWSEPAVFVDELDLPPRHQSERGGAPDYGLLWPERVWLIELKTERASHRHDQIPSYFRLAGHHYPGLALDVTYLTPPMPRSDLPLSAGQRYAHCTWGDVVPLIGNVWGASSDSAEARVCQQLVRVLDGLSSPASAWRALFLDESQDQAHPRPSVPADVGAVTDDDEMSGIRAADVLDVAQLTAADGRQRVVDTTTESLQGLHDRRKQIRDWLNTQPAESPLRLLRPWLWNAATSGGRALSVAGAEHGFEVRISRYAAS